MHSVQDILCPESPYFFHYLADSVLSYSVSSMSLISPSCNVTLLSICSDKLELWLNFLGQTTASGCEGATKPPAHPADGDGVTCRNVGKLHMLTRLSPRSNFIQFCRRESFKTLRSLHTGFNTHTHNRLAYTYTADTFWNAVTNSYPNPVWLRNTSPRGTHENFQIHCMTDTIPANAPQYTKYIKYYIYSFLRHMYPTWRRPSQNLLKHAVDVDTLFIQYSCVMTDIPYAWLLLTFNIQGCS